MFMILFIKLVLSKKRLATLINWPFPVINSVGKVIEIWIGKKRDLRKKIYVLTCFKEGVCIILIESSVNVYFLILLNMKYTKKETKKFSLQNLYWECKGKARKVNIRVWITPYLQFSF